MDNLILNRESNRQILLNTPKQNYVGGGLRSPPMVAFASITGHRILGNHPNRGGGGLKFYLVFRTFRLGNGFYKDLEVWTFNSIPNLQTISNIRGVGVRREKSESQC